MCLLFCVDALTVLSIWDTAKYKIFTQRIQDYYIFAPTVMSDLCFV